MYFFSFNKFMDFYNLKERISSGFNSFFNKINIFFRSIRSKFISRKILKYFSFFAGFLLLLFIGFVISVYMGFFGKLPGTQELRDIRNPFASEVYSSDSVLMGRYYIQNRLDLDDDELTPIIKNALLSTEDVRFYEHGGIDFRSLFRVVFKTILLSREGSGGGSTITQQLAKNLFPRGKLGILSMPVNKLREMIIALRLENIYSKDELLELYLNTVPFGEDTYGIKTASTLFFNKSPGELKIEEAAMLVGMLKATNYYNPRNNPEKAKNRRNIVLMQLSHYGRISEDEADSLSALPLSLKYSSLPYFAGIAPYFREYLRQELDRQLATISKEDGERYNLYTDGLKIYTTIDSRLQKYAREAVNEHLSYLQNIFDAQWKDRDIWKSMNRSGDAYLNRRLGENIMSDTSSRRMKVFSWEGDSVRRFSAIDSIKYFMNFLQTGFLVLDVNSSEIKAWVGGIDFKYFKYDHVLSSRQTGSVFKPLVYLAALQNGVNPCDYYPNDSIVYPEYEDWSPQNADRNYGGEYSVKGALTHSVNTVSAALIIETGTEKVIDIARKVGIESDIPPVPSIALGTANLSLFDILRFYSALASGGIKKEPVYLKKITNQEGQVLFEANNKPAPERVFTRDESEIMTAMLENVVNNGTAGALRYKYGLYNDIAGKTGTTQNNSDGWFVGYTPSFVAGAWVGGELPGIRFRSTRYGQGAFSAMPIFAKFLQKVYKDPDFSNLQNSFFQISEDVREMLDCEDFREKPPLEEIIRETIIDKLRKWGFFRKRKIK